MSSVSSSLLFLLNLAKAQSVMMRKFDSRLGGGIGFSDFMILYFLSQAEDGRMRRIDLADSIGLTASGVTRQLAPMEKIGLVSREVDSRDARVSYVMLAPGGRRLLSEKIEKAEMLAQEVIPASKRRQVESASDIIKDIAR